MAEVWTVVRCSNERCPERTTEPLGLVLAKYAPGKFCLQKGRMVQVVVASSMRVWVRCHCCRQTVLLDIPDPTDDDDLLERVVQSPQEAASAGESFLDDLPLSGRSFVLARR